MMLTESTFSTEELARYSRHFSLPEVGLAGQQRLQSARVLCVGAGGLGSPLLLYLAAAGIGTIGIVDDDVVDITNLQRQVLYTTADINEKKTKAAQARLQALNPYVELVLHDTRLDHDNALELIAAYDVVADGTDNFATRYLVNDACFHLQKPNVHASIFQFEGQCSVFTAPNGPCYRCLYDAPPPPGLIPNCAEGGVFGVLPGLLGTIQATEVIKLLLGIGSPLIGKLLTVDALSMRFRQLDLTQNPHCRLCAEHQDFASLPHHNLGSCTMTTTENEVIPHITVQELAKLLQQQAKFTLLDVRDPYEYEICNIQGKLLPLAELPERLDELDKNLPMIVHCKAGPRSQRAAALLQDAGFLSVCYLTGGILAWAREIDPSLQTY